MKNLIYIFITILCVMSNSLFSQSSLPQPGSNLTDARLDKFVGSWIYIKGTDTVQMRLKKENQFINMGGGFYMDAVVGCYSYKKGGSLIENYLPFFSQTYSANNLPITANILDNANIIIGIIRDKPKKKRQHIEMLLNTDLNTLTVTLELQEGICLGCLPGKTLPDKMVFKRQ